MIRSLKLVSLFLGGCLLMLTACDEENPMMHSQTELTASTQDGALMKTGRTVIWADGQLFDSIVTPASFKPGSGNFDILFNGPFKDGVGHISDAKPGDQDYNGGRWAVYNLKPGVDGSKYNNADSDDDLEMKDFESAGVYFECPLLPRK